MLPSRSKAHDKPLSHQLGAWWQSSTRSSLTSKLLMLTVVVLLLSSLLLMHSIVSNWNSARGGGGAGSGGGGGELTSSNNEMMLSKVSEPTQLMTGSRQKKPGDVNLARQYRTRHGAARWLTNLSLATRPAHPRLTRCVLPSLLCFCCVSLLPAPLSRPVLGHASWAMLHTMAALFPEDASLTKQSAMISFLTALGELYPCATCARHFRLFMSQHPLPPLGALHRDSLSKWLCAAHNGVNARTDKPIQDCALIADLWPSKLEQDCGCDAEDEPASAASAAKTKDSGAAPAAAAVSAPTIDPAAAASSLSQHGPITDPVALRRAIAAQSVRDARGKHKAALIEEEERDKAAAAQEEERRKAAEREQGAIDDPANFVPIPRT